MRFAPPSSSRSRRACPRRVVHDALERVRGMRPLEASRALCASLELATRERVAGEALLERTSPLLDAQLARGQAHAGRAAFVGTPASARRPVRLGDEHAGDVL